MNIRALGLLGLLAVTAPSGLAGPYGPYFQFQRPTELGAIVSTMAKLGRFNVLVSPQVQRQVTFESKGLDARDALAKLCKDERLELVRATYVTGSETWVVASAPLVLSKTPVAGGSELGPRVNLTFRKPTLLNDIMTVTGTLGKIDIDVDPSITIRMQVELRDVAAGEAVQLLAEACKLAVVVAPAGKSGRPHFRVVPAPAAGSGGPVKAR